ncbi:MACPF domain-containing protein At1g14780-like [Amaranthus tricolor]|uniref:MACPF domain-containing protein At1g14780-like n=1 Tax=Amaranthus tricolor TaxID=29722 RepID=UPI00258A318C|nr:MACPF domain-containing protein At1g14780-like [Amaranthus tricolor]
MERWCEETEKNPIELRAVEALGFGFDLTSDFRLKFAKKERLIVFDETHKRDVFIPGINVSIPGVSVDIRCDKGEQLRFKSDVLQFNQMSELLNQKSGVQGKVPSGYFNAIFNFSGAWLNDATECKHLAFDGYFVALYHLHLMTSSIVLHEKVKKSVPSHWDPTSLSRFIQKYGTHIIVGLAVGGQDLICVRQTPSSEIPPAELRAHLEDLGDALFSDGKNSLLRRKALDGKQNAPEVFSRILQSNIIQLTSVLETSNKDGLSVIRSRRGGDVYMHNHSQWLQTVPSHPDAILFKFVPITSLLTGIAGSGYLSHAINLYLRYKPTPEYLQYFLEFQVPRQWAPMYNELPLQHQRIITSSSPLQFSLMGPKIHVNSTKVTSSLKPIVGLRLYLEGRNCNQLAIHAQHLTTSPNSMIFSSPHDQCQWRGSDNLDPEGQYLEPLRWKRFSKVCTSIVKHDPSWLQGKTTGVYIVTGAQLLTKGRWPKTVLHLRLLYSHLPNCTIRKTEWAAAPQSSHKTSILVTLSTTFTFTQKQNSPPKKLPAALNSGVYPNGPPVPVNSEKLLKYVDISEVLRGPHDAPGHWLVTAAKLVTDGGKIGLHVKFALIDYTNDM